jgi:hypothetical protein
VQCSLNGLGSIRIPGPLNHLTYFCAVRSSLRPPFDRSAKQPRVVDKDYDRFGVQDPALSKTGQCSPSLRPLRSRKAAAVISEKISGRSAPAAKLTPSSIMKKKSSSPLHEAPFGFARPALGKSSGSVYQLDHIPPPFRFQSFNIRATPPFIGTLYSDCSQKKRNQLMKVGYLGVTTN